VSIIIPVFNGEKYLSETIESALNQTIRPKPEIIIVDDGSTDGTTEFLKELRQDKKFKIIFKENGGPASALNAGIREAKGEWIKWLSADDVLLPTAIENMFEIINDHDDLEKNKNTIFYTNYHIIDQNGKHLRDLIEPPRPLNGNDLWKAFYGSGSTSLIHKDVFKKCGLFDESLRASEDYEFWLRCTQLHHVALQLLPIFTVNYRIHPDQLTNKLGGRFDKGIKDKIKSQLASG